MNKNQKKLSKLRTHLHRLEEELKSNLIKKENTKQEINLSSIQIQIKETMEKIKELPK